MSCDCHENFVSYADFMRFKERTEDVIADLQMKLNNIKGGVRETKNDVQGQ